LYVSERAKWREWLCENHKSAKEIWLVFFKKASGKPRLLYDAAVEEALCFGWIDGIVKSVDEESFAQRFCPRRPKSNLSELNKERIRRMLLQGLMTDFGLASVKHHLKSEAAPSVLACSADPFPKFQYPKDVLKALKATPNAWKNFQSFPEHYKRIRVAYINDARDRPEAFKNRLDNFVEKSANNQKIGTKKYHE